MIDFQGVLAVAWAELRVTRRLVRYWVFLGLAYLIGLVSYFYYAGLHMFASSWSATAASIGPRYLMGAVGNYATLIFVVAIVFLGFDLRARDQRERMAEVLDSRPIGNLELVAGRFVGLLAAVWVPVAVLAVLIEALGLLLPLLGSPIGEPIETWSVVTWVVFMSLPSFAFALAFVFLVTLVVRNRLVAAVVLLGLLGLDFYGWLKLPLYSTPLVDLTGALMVTFPSELVPRMADGIGWMQRCGVLVAGLGLVVLAAAVHPRLDDGSRKGRAGVAAAILLAGLALLGGASWSRLSDLHQLEAWKAAHAARAKEPVLRLDSVTGKVTIDPGRRLDLDVELAMRAPERAALPSLLLSLNPGLEVQSLTDAAGQPVAFTHRDGLLEVARPLPAGAATSLRLKAGGRLDRRFGYLDSSRVPEKMSAREAQIALLGVERAIFDKRYVALMPGVRWLPAAGADVGRDDPSRPRDLFTVDLEVSVPPDFLVAGPGLREELGGGRFRFHPNAPVPDVALMASRFVVRSATIEGVSCEILLSPRHTRNLVQLADASGEIVGWVGERLREARDVGLPYPYGAFSLVEIPVDLRGYGGGWRLDTVMAPPAMVLLRESCFPTARFDYPFRKPEAFRDQEGGVPRAKLDRVKAHFVNDFSGGNVLAGAARNFLYDQTAAAGPEALALDFLLEQMGTRLITDSRGYFSAHVFSPELNQTIGNAIATFFTSGKRGESFADVVIRVFTSRLEVWEAVLDASLRDLDPWKNPSRAVDVLTLKGGALAQSLLDADGRQKVGATFAALLASHRGSTFTLADLVAAGKAAGVDHQLLLEHWLRSTRLPGFVCSEARTFRLPDTTDGSARYQLLLTLRNDEPVDGLLKVTFQVGDEEKGEPDSSSPILVAGQKALELGLVRSKPMRRVMVEPYLSLNREPFMVVLPPVDEEKVVSAEPFDGTREVAWTAPKSDVIVVDDLDPGFTVNQGDGRQGLRIAIKKQDGPTDQGLPVAELNRRPSEWSRAVRPGAYGRYRHTLAMTRAGTGKRSASFTAEMPRPGSYGLELHFPIRRDEGDTRFGTWHLTLVTGAERKELSFDASTFDQGWNQLGVYPLPAGKVAVEISDKSDGRMVYADAIRWTPAGG